MSAFRSRQITNQDDFNKTFGMATRMGKDGMPTEIDFNKEFIIGEILPETDVETTIEPVSLRKTGSNELTLTYSIKRGAKRSYTTKPMFILKVDNKYKNLKLTDKLIEK